ncbi:UDP-N-acetylmuramoyl-L-alanyl-D-glutamate--2,6-diaminopimelate ligase [Flavobacteriaceae bacterium UJ101]|nr:UDP-N-acetylmuramoyl-L-alanyl-D-glutamate--2,6-diaminopimelate ligase [Flavobacteriaceae bacterium UJ101]
MKKLKDILYKVSVEQIIGSTDVFINNLESDSRKVELDTFFIALKGVFVDGHQFIDKAIQQGAKAVLCEIAPEKIVNGVTYVIVKDSADALGVIAGNFYGNPSQKIQLVGITGTNGKTTTATLLYHLFQNLGYQTALLSTISVRFGKEEIPATHTTPDVITINKYLAQAVEIGCDYAFMEVSSHGIHQKRIAGLEFVGGVFTNLTHDHLDYHKTFKEYLNAKKLFFDDLPESAFALTNIDDKNGYVMLQNSSAKKFSYALKTDADFKGKLLENRFDGMLMTINEQEVWARLVGKFNAYNLLVAFGVAKLLEQDELEILTAISKLESVRGRFQYNLSEKDIVTIVDYAHTPDALKNVLNTINDIRTGNEQVITVVGCGGDRDKTKRPIMASVACELSNQVIFTSDNPRTEDPEIIIEEMEAGVQPQFFNKTMSISNRKEAIKAAIKIAKPEDIILIAGKGHETYQEINGVRTEFDDFQISKNLLKQLNK